MCRESPDAADTISLLKRKSVDLVILDIYLPDELGAEMLPKMREQFPSVDVIIISASTENEHLHRPFVTGRLTLL